MQDERLAALVAAKVSRTNEGSDVVVHFDNLEMKKMTSCVEGQKKMFEKRDRAKPSERVGKTT